MQNIIHYTTCPVCLSPSIAKAFEAKDHTVTGNLFQVWECKDCHLRFTQDVPGANEMAPYYKSDDYISHSNTSKGMINRMYLWVRAKTLRQKRKLVQQLTGRGKGKLLDLGSGTGSFAYEMEQSGWQVTALEPDPGAREKAKELYGIHTADSNLLYELLPGSFDAVTLWHVLEHVHDLHKYLSQLSSVLNDHGKLFVAVPNYTSKDAAVYGEHWAAYDVPRHLYHFSPASMKLLMESHGFKIFRKQPMWYDSFYISMLSSRYKHGSTQLFSSFWNGLRSNLKALNNRERCSSVIYIMEKMK